MKKLLILMILFVVLAGCSPEEQGLHPSQPDYTGLLVIKKETRPHYSYYLLLSKGTQQIRFQVTSSIYDQVQEGTLVDIYLNSSKVITKVNYPALK